MLNAQLFIIQARIAEPLPFHFGKIFMEVRNGFDAFIKICEIEFFVGAMQIVTV
jgi:hypothetical protein